MAFTNYTIVPDDGTVVIDGNAAFGVNMAGISATVHAIQWKGVQSSGTIEYKVDPENGELPPPGSFTSASAYATQTAQAEAIINAQQNPVTYYYNSTASGFPLGTPVVVSTVGWPQPPYTTALVPPTPASFQQLYWYSNAWVVSSFDPSLSLSAAKTFLNLAVETSASSQGQNQARIYSTAQLFAAANVSVLPTADYSGTDLGEYQVLLDAEVASLEGTIAAATTTTSLYSFDPNVTVTVP
jgi:hypothetical protein